MMRKCELNDSEEFTDYIWITLASIDVFPSFCKSILSQLNFDGEEEEASSCSPLD